MTHEQQPQYGLAYKQEAHIDALMDGSGWSANDAGARELEPHEPTRVDVPTRTKKKQKPFYKWDDLTSSERLEWDGIPYEPLTPEQIATNEQGIAEFRAAGQKQKGTEVSHDRDAMVAAAMASWEQVVADHRQIRVDSEVAERGIYTSLDERHAALETINASRAQMNKATHFREALDDDVQAEALRKRYEDPEHIAHSMAITAVKSQLKLDSTIMSLTKKRELETSGFDANDIAAAAAMTKQEIDDAFGENTHSADRAKKLRLPRAAAKKRS